MCVSIRVCTHSGAHHRYTETLRDPDLGVRKSTQVQVHTLQACMCASRHGVLAGHIPSHYVRSPG